MLPSAPLNKDIKNSAASCVDAMGGFDPLCDQTLYDKNLMINAEPEAADGLPSAIIEEASSEMSSSYLGKLFMKTCDNVRFL